MSTTQQRISAVVDGILRIGDAVFRDGNVEGTAQEVFRSLNNSGLFPLGRLSIVETAQPNGPGTGLRQIADLAEEYALPADAAYAIADYTAMRHHDTAEEREQSIESVVFELVGNGIIDDAQADELRVKLQGVWDQVSRDFHGAPLPGPSSIDPMEALRQIFGDNVHFLTEEDFGELDVEDQLDRGGPVDDADEDDDFDDEERVA